MVIREDTKNEARVSSFSEKSIAFDVALEDGRLGDSGKG
jgi:hypothetical protein